MSAFRILVMFLAITLQSGISYAQEEIRHYQATFGVDDGYQLRFSTDSSGMISKPRIVTAKDRMCKEVWCDSGNGKVMCGYKCTGGGDVSPPLVNPKLLTSEDFAVVVEGGSADTIQNDLTVRRLTDPSQIETLRDQLSSATAE